MTASSVSSELVEDNQAQRSWSVHEKVEVLEVSFFSLFFIFFSVLFFFLIHFLLLFSTAAVMKYSPEKPSLIFQLSQTSKAMKILDFEQWLCQWDWNLINGRIFKNKC